MAFCLVLPGRRYLILPGFAWARGAGKTLFLVGDGNERLSAPLQLAEGVLSSFPSLVHLLRPGRTRQIPSLIRLNWQRLNKSNSYHETKLLRTDRLLRWGPCSSSITLCLPDANFVWWGREREKAAPSPTAQGSFAAMVQGLVLFKVKQISRKKEQMHGFYLQLKNILTTFPKKNS